VDGAGSRLDQAIDRRVNRSAAVHHYAFAMTYREVNVAPVETLNVPAVHLGAHKKPLLRGDIVVEINDVKQGRRRS